MSARRAGLLAQAGYFGATGLWSVFHRRSFEAVTGPKADYWLVRLVGGLAAAIGGALAIGARAPQPSRETVALAVGSAAAFGLADAVYAGRGRIRRVYLADLVAEAGFLAALALTRRRASAGRPS